MIYRAAGVGDVALLHAMLVELARHEGSTVAATEEDLARHGFGARPLYHAVLAEEAAQTGPRAAGMAIYYPDFSTHRGQPGVYVQDLYVDRAARGAGIGRGLLAAVMRMQGWGARYLTLGVSPDNAGAVAFYARIGFRARGYRFMILDGERLEGLQ